MIPENKIITLYGVRSTDDEDGYPKVEYVEGRWVVRAFNQGGNDCTDVDFFDLLKWAAEHEDVVKALAALQPQESA